MAVQSCCYNCNANVMRQLLLNRYSDTRRFAVAQEVGNQTGYQARRLDMVVVDVYRSSGFTVEGIEIKVSKSDLRKELQDSSKHNIFFDDLDYYSLAAPREIIDKDIIPKHWGIYAAEFKDGQWKLKTIRKPLSLHDVQLSTIDRAFFACLSRALACQSPTASALAEAREEGHKKGVEDEKRNASYLVREAQENTDKLRSYESLFQECRLWGADDIEKGIREFTLFRKMRAELHWLPKRLDSLMESAAMIRGGLAEFESEADHG